MPIPAVGRIPVELARKEEWAEVTESTWYAMAFEIARLRPEDFFRLHAFCNKHVREPDLLLPTRYAAQYVFSPSLAAMSPHPPPPPPSSKPPCRMYVGPPPPPPPARASRFSLMTQQGLVPFTPDEVFEC